MSVALEARLLGLQHQPACPGDRVEIFDTARPGPASARWSRGPTQLGPATPVRVARCMDCAATAVREIELREQVIATAGEIDAKEQAQQ